MTYTTWNNLDNSYTYNLDNSYTIQFMWTINSEWIIMQIYVSELLHYIKKLRNWKNETKEPGIIHTKYEEI